MSIENDEIWFAMKSKKYSNILLELASMESEKGLDSILNKMLETFCKAIHAEAGTLWYYDKKGFDYIYPKCAFGKSEISDIKLKFGDGIVGNVIKDNKPLIIYDCSKDSRWNSTVDEKTGFVTKSIMCVPLCVEGSEYPFGAIQIINKTDNNLFDDIDLDYSTKLAKECVDILIQKLDDRELDILSGKRINIRFDEIINLSNIEDVKSRMSKSLSDNGYDADTTNKVIDEIVKIYELLKK